MSVPPYFGFSWAQQSPKKKKVEKLKAIKKIAHRVNGDRFRILRLMDLPSYWIRPLFNSFPCFCQEESLQTRVLPE
jgi:hypothetical protein